MVNNNRGKERSVWALKVEPQGRLAKRGAHLIGLDGNTPLSFNTLPITARPLCVQYSVPIGPTIALG